MSKTFSAGSVSIDLSDDLQRFVDRAIKEVSPNTAKAIGDEVAELRQYAQKKLACQSREIRVQTSTA